MTLLDRWADDAKARGISRQTIDSYRYNLKYFENFLGRSIDKADKIEIRDYVDAQRKEGLTTKTIRGRLNALSSFYEFLIFEELRVDNPVGAIRSRYINQYKTASEEHTHKLISIKEATNLVMCAFDPRDQAMLVLLLKTGVRRSELLNMDVSDIDFGTGSIRLKPTAKRSNLVVFFDDEAARFLHRWLEVRQQRHPTDDALWISTWGKRVGHGSLNYMIRHVALRAGLHNEKSELMEDHFSPHCTRHWFTTHLRRAGMPREFIQELRGDVRREAIDIYDHIDKEELRKSYLAHIPQLGV